MSRLKERAPLGFFVARLVILFSLPWEGLVAYNDLRYYYAFAALPGWPLVHHWAEYPPLIPWLLEGLYRLSGGQEVPFVYALAVLFSAAQAFSLWLVWDLAEDLWPEEAPSRALTYAALTVGLLYSWGYFDPLIVALTLGGVWLWQRQRPWLAGLSVALGILGKWFPLLVGPAWFKERPRVALRSLAGGLVLVALVWLGAWTRSPAMTQASLLSQAHKGSWETPWALLDGNLRTGLFGPLTERFDPQAALRAQGNPPRLAPGLTLIPFLLLGLAAWLRFRPRTPAQSLAFIGLTWTIFLLWSPGYSPQWVLYLLPWALLGLPQRRGVLFGIALVGINLLEWPLALSRGLFEALWWIIPLRTALLVLLALAFWESASPKVLLGGERQTPP